MRQRFKSVDFKPESLAKIDYCNEVIGRYEEQGLKLTLRQLYYQLVSQNVIPNEERSYKNLGSLVSNARLSGLIDWDAIEDRIREPQTVTEFRDLDHLARTAVAAYRLPRWEDQDAYVELWVEKDALAGVLEPLARDNHVTLMVNRGYSSQSAMYESAQRFLKAEESGKYLHLFYLGDHDPSGEDMVRDVRDRLAMFGVEVEVRKLALTMEQIRKHRPPPNPAKVSDSRAAAYIAKHGDRSWEVDALPPEELARIIQRAFSQVIDLHRMDAVKRREEEDKYKLLDLVSSIMGSSE